MPHVSRLEALKKYRILDSEAEEQFNALVALAAAICETPIALISLLDQDRQWFKAKLGIEIAETPLDHAICAHSVRSGKDIFVVNKASTDPVFRDNPLVVEAPHIEFYAGAVLTTPENQRLGTLCVIDTIPRSLSERQLECLRIISKQVMYLMELRRSSLELLDKLGDLKILEGQWKVCMYCRRVEDEHGNWSQFESLFRRRTHAEFSHGICQSCFNVKMKNDTFDD